MINKPLYDTITVNLAKLSIQDCERLLKKKDKVMEKYVHLLKNKKFASIITSGTAAIDNVKYRHSEICKLFQEVLEDD